MSTKVKLNRQQLEETCRGYADAFRDVVPDGVGFTIFLFDFGTGGNTAYVSSADRADMVRLIEEWLRRQKGGA